MEYGLEDYYEFTVISELEMKGMSCKVTLPKFSALANKEVTRETGFIGVEARTNVEVEELETEGLSMIDIREVRAVSVIILISLRCLMPSLKWQ